MATGPKAASVAADYLDHEDPNVRTLAGSVLAQVAAVAPSDEERAALTAERADLVRKLDKRRGEGGFAANVAAIEVRIAEIDAALAVTA